MATGTGRDHCSQDVGAARDHFRGYGCCRVGLGWPPRVCWKGFGRCRGGRKWRRLGETISHKHGGSHRQDLWKRAVGWGGQKRPCQAGTWARPRGASRDHRGRLGATVMGQVGEGRDLINYSRPYPRQIKRHGFGALEKTTLGSRGVWEVQGWDSTPPTPLKPRPGPRWSGINRRCWRPPFLSRLFQRATSH